MAEFKALLEGFLAGYDNKGSLDYFGGEFALSDTKDSRLEAIAGETSSVWVPLVRGQSASCIGTNQIMRWSFGEQNWSTNVEWTAGISQTFVKVAIPAKCSPGDELELQLLNANGGVVSQSRILVIASVETDQEMPRWVGERTADELQWGEWTMDLDVATQKVARAVAGGTNAYTVALCGGELWCGDCKGTRKYLCSTSEFKEWARTNHVALVLIDIPSKDTSPTMLSWDESATGVSGAYYLSRKGVDPASADRIFNRNHELCFNIWYKEYENRASHRVWVPTMVLLAGDGRPCGRLLGDRRFPNNPEYASKGVVYTLDTYMQRLNELLLLADDPTEWDNNDWSTTALRVASDGGELSSFLSAVDGNSGDSLNQVVIDVCEIIGCRIGTEQCLEISGDQAARLQPVFQTVVRDGGTNAVTQMAGPSFLLSDGISWTVTNTMANARCFLVLKGDDQDFFAYNRPADSMCSYTLHATSALLCSEKSQTTPVQEGATLHIRIEQGQQYVLSGVGLSVEPSELLELGGNHYRAVKTGIAELTISESGTLEYQLWRTGKLSFAVSEVRVSERAGQATVEVRRTDGSSGAAEASVCWVGGTARSIDYDPEYGAFQWDGPVTLVWPDGVATNQTVSFPVFNRSPRWEGDQTVQLSLIEGEESAASVAEPTICTVTILETDVKAVGRLQLLQDDAKFVKSGLAYARAGERLDFSLVRVAGANTDVQATLSAGTGGTVTPTSADWPNNGAEAERAFELSLEDNLEAGEVIEVRINPVGIKMADGLDRFSVVIVGDEAPGLEVSALSQTLSQYVDCEASVGITASESYAFCRAVRLFGNLPAGLAAVVEGDRLFFQGVPSEVGTFESTWRIDGVRADGSSVAGDTVKLELTVVPVADVCEAAHDESFPGVVETFCRYAGFAVSPDNGLRYTLSLMARNDGEMQMVLEGSDGRVRLEADSWSGADAGAVRAQLDSSEGVTASLAWTNDSGTCCFVGSLIEAGGEDLSVCLWPESCCGEDVDSGVYTVDIAPLEAGSGHAFLTMKVSSSQTHGTRVTYAGMLPDGRQFSGTGTLVGRGSDVAFLPIVKRTASGTLRVLLRIAPAASDIYSDYNHSVSNQVPVFWDRPTAMSKIEMTAGGGYYDASVDMESVCTISDYLTADALYRVSVPWDGIFNAYGLNMPGECPTRHVQVVDNRVRLLACGEDPSRLSFAVSRSSGVFSGRFKALTESGAAKTVSLRGVVLLNWGEACKSGCGQGPRPGPFKPFCVGTAYMTGHAGLSGAEFKLIPIQDE